MGGHVLVAPDKFKGSLTAAEAARRIARGISRASPGAEVRVMPVADGGEGTVLAAAAAGFSLVPARVAGPAGHAGPSVPPVTAQLAVRGDVAVVEAAQACGLHLLPGGIPRPLRASSYGVGELIAAAIRLGCTTIVLGLGGVASTDGGAGMAQALGARILDGAGRPVPPGGAALANARSVDLGPLAPGAHAGRPDDGSYRPRAALLDGVTVVVASDVDNTLLGLRGAAAVYGPQKGATPSDVAVLDAALRQWADLVASAAGADLRDAAGAGAAGGLGFGALALLGASVRPGITLLLDLLGFASAVRGARLVVTGEGCLDSQTLHGKAPAGVLAAAAEAGVPVAVVAGRVALPEPEWRAAGFAAAYSLADLAGPGADSLAQAAALAEHAGTQIARDFP